MKKVLLGSLVALVLIVAAFLIGRFEGAKNEYHYQVLEDKQFESASGPVHAKCVMEYVGIPFLEPETTLIEVDGRLIYKAKRMFQESYPVARNIRTHDDLIEWDDGEYSFSLRMQKLPPHTPAARPTAAPVASFVVPPLGGRTKP